MSQEPDRHPVWAGLIALVGVGLAVGLLVSGGALAATHVLGLSGGADSATSTSRQSMYIPRPSPTESSTGPAVTLAPGESTPADTPSATPTPEFPITLSAGSDSVGSYDRIELTGIYPTGEGHIVQVQRLEGGQWVDFSTVDSVVSGSTFSTFVQTSRTGVNQWRVRDTDTEAVSNEVDVTVG